MNEKKQDIERIEAFMQAGDPAGAEAFCRERLAETTGDGHRVLLLDYLVNLLLAGQKPEGAEQACREELALLEKLFGTRLPSAMRSVLWLKWRCFRTRPCCIKRK